MFAQAVADYWNVPPIRGDVILEGSGVTIVSDPSLPDNRRVSHLVLPSGGDLFALRPEVASALTPDLAALREATTGEVPGGDATRGEVPGSGDAPGSGARLADRIAGRLEELGERFHDWEYVFYLPLQVRESLAATSAGDGIRALTADDAEAFAAFHAACSEPDREEAFVELDHWLVAGFVAPDGRIGCVASVYPWDGSRLADVGILTAPEFRGRGLGAQVVAHASRLTLAAGYEPQYRCQLSNAASRATGERAGFELFTRWRAVTGEDPAESGGAVH